MRSSGAASASENDTTVIVAGAVSSPCRAVPAIYTNDRILRACSFCSTKEMLRTLALLPGKTKPVEPAQVSLYVSMDK